MATPKEKLLYFFTAYDFKPEGVALLGKRVEKDLQKTGANAIYEYRYQDCCFIIQCSSAIEKTVFIIFHKAIKTLIKEERGVTGDDSDDGNEDDEYDMDDPIIDSEDEQLESSKISRLPPIGILRHASDLPGATSSTADYPEDFRHHKFMETWHHDDSLKNLDVIISDTTMKVIEDQTGCHLLKDLNSQNVFVGAHTGQVCQIVLRKLDNIKKDLGPISRYINHLFYTEDIEKVEVAVKPLLDIKNKRLDTTLFDWWAVQPLVALGEDFDPYKSLVRSCTVICCVYDHPRSIFVPIKPSKLVPAVKDEDKSKQLDSWRNFKYCAFGKPKDYYLGEELEQQTVIDEEIRKPTLLLIGGSGLGEASKDKRIKKWLPQIPGPIETDLQFLHDSAYHGSMPPQVASPFTHQQQPVAQPWDTHRDLESAADQTLPTRTRSPSSAYLNPGTHSNQTIKSTDVSDKKGFPALGSAKGLNTQMKPTHGTQKVVPRLNISDTDQFPALGTATSKGVPPKSNTARQSSQNLARSVGQAPPSMGERSLLDDSPPRVMPHHQIAPNHPARVDSRGHRTPNTHPLDESISFHSQEFRVLQPTRRSPYNEKDTLQETDEVSTRQYHNTMNQRAPKPLRPSKSAGMKHPKKTSAKLPALGPIKRDDTGPPKTGPTSADPLPEFTASSKVSFYKILEGLEAYRGQLNVQAEFGRIVLGAMRDKSIASGSALNSMDAGQLQDILLRPKANPQTGPHAIFTKVLTTIPADIQYMIDLKNSEGASQWEPNPAWEVQYEFHCLDHKTAQAIPFLIVINAETFATRVSTEEQLLGEVFIHCTKSNWDIRLTATGLRNKEDEYGHFANVITRSLYTKSGKEPELMFEIPKSEQQVVNFFRVRRTCYYKSKNNTSVLKVSEVQHMGIPATCTLPGNDCVLYKVSTDFLEKYPEPGKQTSWHEVSVLSIVGNELFAANDHLELGDEAGWNTTMLEKEDIASAVIIPALWLVKRIDGVGFYNDNGRGELARKAETLRAFSIAEPQEVFW